jgi:hypothetical protein
MQVTAVLIVLAQLYLAWHAIRAGRDNWIYLILFFPVIGCLLYIFMEILPRAKMQRTARGLGGGILKTVDPTRNLRKLREKVDISGSVKNKHDLAAEMIHLGMSDEAIEILKDLPQGVFKDDANILLTLAHAYFNKEAYAEALATLDRIKAANPDYHSQEAHLLYARGLENLGRWEEALDDYEGLVRYFSGEEARCRMALLLQKMGHTEKSGKLFKDMLEKAKRSPRDYCSREKEWIRIAERHGG